MITKHNKIRLYFIKIQQLTGQFKFHLHISFFFTYFTFCNWCEHYIILIKLEKKGEFSRKNDFIFTES